MRKLFGLLLAFVFSLTMLGGALSDGAAYSFTEDVDALDLTAKSVFYVEVLNANKNTLGFASGFVCFDEGLFVTNQHVIQDASYLRIEDEEGNEYTLNKVIASDSTYDVAILLFPEGKNYRSLEIDTETELKRGQKIVTIGNPIGYRGTIAFGNISAFPVMKDYGGLKCIQFTAPISSGSSGGCLFNDYGKLIGITSAGGISTFSGEKGENINLAVPISVAADMYREWDKSSFETLGSEKSWNMVGNSFAAAASTPIPAPADGMEKADALPVGTDLGRFGIVNSNVYLHTGPSVESGKIGDGVQDGAYVYLLMNEKNDRGEIWTRVSVNGETGYIRSECINVIEGNADSVSGYAYVSANSVNVKKMPFSQSKKTFSLSKYAYIELLDTLENDGITWYYIRSEGREGYLDSRFVKTLDETENEAFLQSPEYAAGQAETSSGGD